jgi:putative DNA primase/helicase
LDARVERPEDRHFERDDLVGHVQTHRAAYVVAALTLLRAYHAAGRPRHHAGPRMGSFEAWDDRIRGAVLWLGLDDPASSDEDKGRGRIRADSDADVEQHGTLLEALAAAFPGGQWFTVQEVMTRMQAGEGGLTERRQGHGLKAAVEMVVPVGKNGVVSPQGLGSVLRSLRDRVVDGRVLRCRKQRGGQSMRWAVMEAGA